jgi:hypothetical protein
MRCLTLDRFNDGVTVQSLCSPKVACLSRDRGLAVRLLDNKITDGRRDVPADSVFFRVSTSSDRNLEYFACLSHG